MDRGEEEYKQEAGGAERREGHIVRWKLEESIPVPPIPDTNFASLLLHQMSHHGDKKALVDARTGKHHTYSDIRALVPRVCGNLAAAGVALGDAVLLMSPNHIDFAIAMLAVQLLPAICVPLNPSFTPEEVAHAVRVSGATWAVVEEGVVGVVERLTPLLPPNTLRQVWVLGSSPHHPPFSGLLRTPGQDTQPLQTQNPSFSAATCVALMPFSSGTTGLPKGVRLTHRSLLTVYMQRQYLNDLSGQGSGGGWLNRVLLALPLFHIYANSIYINTMGHGGCLVLMAKFSLRGFLETIQRYKITYTPIVPHIAHYLVHSPLLKHYDISSLVGFGMGSAPLPLATQHALMEKTGCGMGEGYAMTETCCTVTINSPALGYKLGSVGCVMPYMQMKIVAPGGGEGLPPGEEGEVWVRSPGVMLGYAHAPGAPPAPPALQAGGWLPTGDLGRCDEEGFLFLTDRIKDMIKVKGFQVSPSEVEEVLREVEGVGEVAVVGVPSPHLGEAPRAYVVPVPGSAAPSTRALVDHVAARLAPNKRLAGGVEVVESLPKNTIGKVLKRRLRDAYLKTLKEGDKTSTLPSKL